MNKKTLLVIVFLFLAHIAGAQIFQWAKLIGGGPTIYTGPAQTSDGKVSALDAFGHIYVVGAGGYLRKFDLDGNMIWSKTTGMNGYSIAADTFGYIYAVGTTNNVVIQKLDSAGNSIWSKVLNGADVGTDIKVDGQANIYVVGHCYGADLDPGIDTFLVDTAGAYLVKLDSAGDFQWAYTIAEPFTNYACFNAVDVDNLGNVFVAGATGHGAFWTGTLRKIDANGQFMWERWYPGTQIQHGSNVFDVKVTDSGYIYTTGLIEYKTGFEGRIFVNKMNSAGVDIWINKFNGQTTHCYQGAIDVDVDGNVYIIGSSEGGANTENWGGGYTFGNPNLYLFKYGPTGNTLWSIFHYVPMNSTNKSYGFNVEVDKNCNVYMTGVNEGTLDMFPGPLGTFTLGSGMFLEKLMCNSTSVKEINHNATLNIYPNPSPGTFTISAPAIIEHVQVTDMLGRVVYNAAPGKEQHNISLSVASGIYHVILTIDRERVVKKIVLE